MHLNSFSCCISFRLPSLDYFSFLSSLLTFFYLASILLIASSYLLRFQSTFLPSISHSSPSFSLSSPLLSSPFLPSSPFFLLSFHSFLFILPSFLLNPLTFLITPLSFLSPSFSHSSLSSFLSYSFLPLSEPLQLHAGETMDSRVEGAMAAVYEEVKSTAKYVTTLLTFISPFFSLLLFPSPLP